MKQLSKDTIIKLLDSIYDLALKGLPGTKSVQELAAEYQVPGQSLEENARTLIRWQIAKCAGSGFVSGLGGLITLPIAVPANVSSVLYVQIRMVAAIACMAGLDVKSDKVQTLVYACLIGNAATEILNRLSVQIGTKVTTNLIERVSGQLLIEINRAVGFRLVTKFGETGVINLGQAVPVIGGVIGGSIDGMTCKTTGKFAVRLFASA